MTDKKSIPCIDCICLSTCKAKLRNLPDNRSMYLEVLDGLSKKCSLLKEFVWVDERAEHGKLSYIPGHVHWVIRFMTSNDKVVINNIKGKRNEA